ncbi:hypothetical protein AALB39_07940 [Lachnospiraceae bacterium 54-53]
MNQIPAVNGISGSGWETVPGAGSRGAEAAGITGGTSGGQVPKDRVQLSEGWSEADRSGMVERALDRLKEQYPSIRMTVAEEEYKKDGLAGLAAGLGKGIHLVISRKFLERMGSSTEEFGRCSSVLAAMAKQLSGLKQGSMSAGAYVGQSGAALWTAEKKTEARADEKEQAVASGFSASVFGEPSEKNQLVSRQLQKTSAVSVSRHYSRLAGARSKGQIQAVMSDVQRSIGNLQMTAVYGDEEEKVKAGRALRSLRKLLGRGSRKISRLNKEQLAAVRKRKAEKEQKEKKAEQARQEMKKLRSGKAGSDHSLVMEGRADESYIKGYRHYRRIKEEYEGIPMSAADPLSAGMTLSAPGEGDAGAAGEVITEADVTVSGSFTY